MTKIRELMIDKLLDWYRNEIRWMNDLPSTRDQVGYYVDSYKEQLQRLEDEHLLHLYTREIKLIK